MTYAFAGLAIYFLLIVILEKKTLKLEGTLKSGSEKGIICNIPHIKTVKCPAPPGDPSHIQPPNPDTIVDVNECLLT